MKDKAKFGELVDRMQSLNTDLYALVHVDNTASLAQALSTYLLPQLKDALSLAALQQTDMPFDPLLALSARLKQLHDAPLEQAAKEAESLFFDQKVEFERPEFGSRRSFGILERPGQLPQRVWVEWKRVSSHLITEDAKLITLRLQALAALLAAPKTDDFRIPPFVGLAPEGTSTAALGRDCRTFGFVYTWPSKSFDEDQRPKTLSELISNENSPMPLLDDRFALAYALALALLLFHACKWLHKGLRSDNILFFPKESEEIYIRSLQIKGFEYSRPENQTLIERRLGRSQNSMSTIILTSSCMDSITFAIYTALALSYSKLRYGPQ
ncbi:hypothetical protein MMC21_001918 [Puttea exsequens]|nr:hypothetical protein [Puttea exsequens]